MDFFEDHVVVIMTVLGAMILIGLYGWLLWTCWVEENTAETIILGNGSKSYACTVSKINREPYNCKPIHTIN